MANNPQHQYGPPQITIAMAAMDVVIKHDNEEVKAEVEAIKECVSFLAQTDLDTCMEIIKILKVKACFVKPGAPRGP